MRALAIPLAILLTTIPVGADQKPSIVFRNLPKKTVDLLVLNVPQTNTIRLAQLKQTFSDLQCKGGDLREQQADEGKNLLCTLPGKSTDTILVLAHYEHEGKGMGAIDNWSGAIMLPFLYHALTAVPRQQTFMLAALYGADGGKVLLHSMTHTQRHSLKAVIALDALGLGPLRFYLRPNGSLPTFSETHLEAQLLQAALDKGLKEPQSTIPGSWLRIDDTRDFRFIEIPAILIHSVDKSKRDLPGSVDDTSAAIDRDVYFEDYTLLCNYLAELDTLHKDQQSNPTPSARGRR